MSGPTTTPAEELTRQGPDVAAAEDPLKAARAFRSAIAVDPGDHEAYIGLIAALREAGQREQAVGAALAFMAIAPSNPAAHSALSRALREAGHPAEAQRAEVRTRILEWKKLLEAAPQ